MSYELVLALSEELKLRTAIAPSGLPVTLGPYFYDLYAKADLALSMRIHSMNPAIGIGTPVIPLVSQSRMAKFMRDAGLERRCVDVFSPSFVDDLVGAMRDALARPEVRRDELREVRDGLRERTRAFNALVDGFVEARVPAAAGG
jgi:polysaccharide pyruvyl transferase WcaK-like protein